MRGVLAMAALLAACGLARGAPEAVQVSTLPCFHGQVRLESVCRAVDASGVYVECDRQTLRTDFGQAQLIGADRGLHADEWSCSADQQRLFVRMDNGGSCPRCEALRVFDAKARRVKDKAAPPPGTTIRVVAPH